MVVAIHTHPFPPCVMPILRLAVPLFFMMSSYFFFSKYQKLDAKGRLTATIRYCKRNLMLYLFWFLALLPITIVYRNWLSLTFGDFIIRLSLQFLFGSTFIASWFIMALVLGVLVVSTLSRWLPNRYLLLFGLFAYILCCLDSNYAGLLETPLLQIEGVSARCSFVVALLWITIGKCLAEHGSVLTTKAQCFLIIVLSFCLLYVEYYVIAALGISKFTDCYFFLIPLAYSIFVLVGRTHGVTIRHAGEMRKFSTVTYCSHASIGLIVGTLIAHGHNATTFILTVMLCSLLFLAIIRLEQFPLMGWLKYSH